MGQAGLITRRQIRAVPAHLWLLLHVSNYLLRRTAVCEYYQESWLFHIHPIKAVVLCCKCNHGYMVHSAILEFTVWHFRFYCSTIVTSSYKNSICWAHPYEISWRHRISLLDQHRSFPRGFYIVLSNCLILSQNIMLYPNSPVAYPIINIRDVETKVARTLNMKICLTRLVRIICED